MPTFISVLMILDILPSCISSFFPFDFFEVFTIFLVLIILYSGLKWAVCNSQFVKCFGSLQMSFCIFSKTSESLKSYIFHELLVIHWTSYIVNYLQPIKYPQLNNNIVVVLLSSHFSSHTTNYVCRECKNSSKKGVGIIICLQLISWLDMCASKSLCS